MSVVLKVFWTAVELDVSMAASLVDKKVAMMAVHWEIGQAAYWVEWMDTKRAA